MKPALWIWMGDNIYGDARRKLTLSNLRQEWKRARSSGLGMLDFVFKPADESNVRLENIAQTPKNSTASEIDILTFCCVCFPVENAIRNTKSTPGICESQEHDKVRHTHSSLCLVQPSNILAVCGSLCVRVLPVAARLSMSLWSNTMQQCGRTNSLDSRSSYVHTIFL